MKRPILKSYLRAGINGSIFTDHLNKYCDQLEEQNEKRYKALEDITHLGAGDDMYFVADEVLKELKNIEK